MKKIAFLLFAFPLIAFSQVKYEAQLGYFKLNILPDVLLAAMPKYDSQEAEEIKKNYDKPEFQKSFLEYNAFEAYVNHKFYEEIKAALKTRFGIIITSMVKKEEAKDSTTYGFPVVRSSEFKKNRGSYFVKLSITVATVESDPNVQKQTADKITLTPTIQIALELYDKKGKKIKKAKGKYSSKHAVEGRLQDSVFWDGKTQMRTFKANETVRKTFLSDLLSQGLGKLQESFYK